MSDKVIDRCLSCLDIIDVRCDGVLGEVGYLKEAFEQQRTTQKNRDKAKDRLKDLWKNDREKMLWKK